MTVQRKVEQLELDKNLISGFHDTVFSLYRVKETFVSMANSSCMKISLGVLIIHNDIA